MRILVATWFVVPGYSGGWTTVLDLLEPEHRVAFLCASAPPGMRECEGTPVRGLPLRARMTAPWPAGNRFREMIFRRSLERAVRRAAGDHEADLVLCLDEHMARAACDAGLPFALRLHSHPGLLAGSEYGRVVESALFVTGSQPGMPGAVFLPHGLDLDRFEYREPPAAEAAVMPTSLVHAERPDVFVRGVSMSGMTGTLVGQGPLRRELQDLCRATGGRVRLLEPVGRSMLPGLLSRHQVGVACLEQGWHTVHQMKVTEYQAAGLFPLVQPWSELAVEAPELTLTFTDAEELADRLDRLRSDWASTLETRRRGREYAFSRFHVRTAKSLFSELLGRALAPAPDACDPCEELPGGDRSGQQADPQVDGDGGKDP